MLDLRDPSPLERIETDVNGLDKKFTDVTQLGHGGFSAVYRATLRDLNEIVAIKAFDRSRLLDIRYRSLFESELKIMEAVDHPFVVLFYNLIHDDEHFYMVMEHCTHSLGSMTTKNTGLPPSLLEKYACQLVCAIHYLHRHLLVVHRDLTLENLLIDAYGNLKIADFGLAKALTESNTLCRTACGTGPYLAPEQVRHESYGEKVDIWQLGIVIYAMAFGTFPFCVSNEAKMVQEILTKTPEFPENADSELRDLILKLLAKDPEARPAIEQVLVHPWILKSEFAGLADWRFVLCQGLTAGPRPSATTCDEMEKRGLARENVMQLGTDDAMFYRILRRKEISNIIGDGRNIQDRLQEVCYHPQFAGTIPALATVQSLTSKGEKSSILGAVLGRLTKTRGSLDTERPAMRDAPGRQKGPALTLHQLSHGSLLAKSCRFRARNRIV